MLAIQLNLQNTNGLLDHWKVRLKMSRPRHDMVLREVRHLWLSWLLNYLLMLLRTYIDVLLINSIFVILIVLVLIPFLFEIVWVFVLDLLPQILFWSKDWWSKVRLFGLLFHELLQSSLWLLETLVTHIWRTVQWRLLVMIILLGTPTTLLLPNDGFKINGM